MTEDLGNQWLQLAAWASDSTGTDTAGTWQRATVAAGALGTLDGARSGQLKDDGDDGNGCCMVTAHLQVVF